MFEGPHEHLSNRFTGLSPPAPDLQCRISGLSSNPPYSCLSAWVEVTHEYPGTDEERARSALEVAGAAGTVFGMH